MPGKEQPIDTSRKILRNPDQSFSTEQTITVGFGDKFFLIPTIVNGKQLSNEDAIQASQKGVNPPVGVFDSLLDANKAAAERSKRIGKVRSVEESPFSKLRQPTKELFNTNALSNLLQKLEG